MANAGVQGNQTGTGFRLVCLQYGPLEERLKFEPEDLGLKTDLPLELL